MTESLSERFEFFVGTLNRDLGQKDPYPEVRPNEWEMVGKTKVFYSTTLGFSVIHRLIAEIRPDALYLNSVFAGTTTRILLGMRLGLLPKIPLVIAPRGEFSPAALSIKPAKKKSYLHLMCHLGIYEGVTWQASSEHEVSDIAKVMNAARIVIAPEHANAVGEFTSWRGASRLRKEPGTVKLVFLSRLSRMKNPLFLLRLLPRLKGNIQLTIAGPAEDRELWRECEALIHSFKDGIRVHYCGEVIHSGVAALLKEHHFFVLPTLGENFGHAIVEALQCGVPAIISDRTPWLNLSTGNAGFDLPLDDPQRWIKILQHCIDLDDEEYLQMSLAASEYAAKASPDESNEKHAQLFASVIGAGRTMRAF